MAVKIIREGKDKTFRVDCPYCFSLLEYRQSDMKDYEKTVGNRVTTEYFIICPACENGVLVKKNTIAKDKDKGGKN